MPDDTSAGRGRAGLLIDFAGVLTTPVTRSFRAFCREVGLPSELVKEVFVEAYRDLADGDGPIHRVETGRITAEEFGAQLCAALSQRSGVDLDGVDLVRRVFAGVELDERMLAAVEAIRRAGVATGLLSNSWGEGGYPRDRFPALFDAVVISGEVGMRKPDEGIYLLAANRLGLEPERCVFVDDLDTNVAAAERVGMTGVVHTSAEETIERLAELLSLDVEKIRPPDS